MSYSAAQDALRISAHEAYARWASSYDETPNPLLALEERSLAGILTSVLGQDVVELGCGTGRWLQNLEAAGAGSLTGVDNSTAMLAQARKKCLSSTSLIHSDCTATPFHNGATDFVLASFLLSYVTDLQKFAAEAGRILRPGGTLTVSDVHPRAGSYGWRRTFKTSRGLFEIATFEYTLADLITILRAAGFNLEAMDEPCFGEEESTIFRRAGMLHHFQQVESLPVIYWARFSRSES
jgi:ubiquinone/menaquinone biosynthesis C-methylase UbiE